ncbi:MAG TPA: hypothetical protein DCP02_06850 [Actinobacteria bacterium]|nr:hypothetical protein [Actinomycetota bacterium]
MKDAPEDKVPDYIYGYTLMSDITVRDIQKKEQQRYRSKSFDTFGPVGPVIVVKDKIYDPQNLNLKSYINGEIRQNENTSDMIFSVYKIISYISRCITLEARDLMLQYHDLESNNPDYVNSG